MEQTRSIQTAFRFTDDMMRRIKNKARNLNMSVNAYVESVLEDDLKEEENTYEEMKAFGARLHTELRDVEPVRSPGLKISPEDIDERTKYILEK